MNYFSSSLSPTDEDEGSVPDFDGDAVEMRVHKASVSLQKPTYYQQESHHEEPQNETGTKYFQL